MNELLGYMSESYESLNELMDSHGMNIADLEYIVKYLIHEKISPQLAMRRIKSFETLKQKLDDTSTQDVIKSLQDQLDRISQEKSSLESKAVELESKTDLFDTEREELKNQLKMLQEMQHDDNDDDAPPENVVNNDLIYQFIDTIKPIAENTSLKDPISILLTSLRDSVESQSLKFDKIQFESALKSVRITDTPSKPPVEEKLETEESGNEQLEKEEVKEKLKEEKPKPTIDPQVERVLNLFLDFVREADNDKDFQNRIDTICEMDEAYEHLGSIGLSQLYSYVSKDLSKKEEFITLLETWKKEGVPR